MISFQAKALFQIRTLLAQMDDAFRDRSLPGAGILHDLRSDAAGQESKSATREMKTHSGE